MIRFIFRLFLGRHKCMFNFKDVIDLEKDPRCNCGNKLSELVKQYNNGKM